MYIVSQIVLKTDLKHFNNCPIYREWCLFYPVSLKSMSGKGRLWCTKGYKLLLVDNDANHDVCLGFDQ